MKGDQHKVQDAKRYEGKHAQRSMDNKQMIFSLAVL